MDILTKGLGTEIKTSLKNLVQSLSDDRKNPEAFADRMGFFLLAFYFLSNTMQPETDRFSIGRALCSSGVDFSKGERKLQWVLLLCLRARIRFEFSHAFPAG